jgi:hypothetical protein
MRVNKLLFKNIFRCAASLFACVGMGILWGTKMGFKHGQLRWSSRKQKAFRNGVEQGILNAMRDDGQI